MNASQAVQELREYLGKPQWLHSIGIGSVGGKETIFLYLTTSRSPALDFLANGWKGFPVVVRRFGSLAPLGK